MRLSKCFFMRIYSEYARVAVVFRFVTWTLDLVAGSCFSGRTDTRHTILVRHWVIAETTARLDPSSTGLSARGPRVPQTIATVHWKRPDISYCKRTMHSMDHSHRSLEYARHVLLQEIHVIYELLPPFTLSQSM